MRFPALGLVFSVPLLGACFELTLASGGPQADAGPAEAEAAPTDAGGAADVTADGVAFGDAVVLVQNMAGPRDLVANTTGLFWLNETDSTIAAVKKDGSQLRVVVPTTYLSLGAIAVDETRLYYGRLNCSINVARIGRVNVDGTSNEPDWRPIGDSCERGAKRLTTDAANVYATAFNANLPGGDIWQFPKDGSPASVLVHSNAQGDAIVSGITFLVLSSIAGNGVFRWNRGATAPDLFANGQRGAKDVALDATHAYWITDGVVARLAVGSGGQPPESIAPAQALPNRLIIDKTHVYWTNLGDGTVRGAPKAGGPSFVVAMDQKEPYGIAVDDAAVYWTNHGDGTVRKAARR